MHLPNYLFRNTVMQKELLPQNLAMNLVISKHGWPNLLLDLINSLEEAPFQILHLRFSIKQFANQELWDYIILMEHHTNTTCWRSPEVDELIFQFLLIFYVFLHLLSGLLHISFHTHQLFVFLPAARPVKCKTTSKFD